MSQDTDKTEEIAEATCVNDTCSVPPFMEAACIQSTAGIAPDALREGEGGGGEDTEEDTSGERKKGKVSDIWSVGEERRKKACTMVSLLRPPCPPSLTVCFGSCEQAFFASRGAIEGNAVREEDGGGGLQQEAPRTEAGSCTTESLFELGVRESAGGGDEQITSPPQCSLPVLYNLWRS
eukprot:952198-Rhodomonas_salina.2